MRGGFSCRVRVRSAQRSILLTIHSKRHESSFSSGADSFCGGAHSDECARKNTPLISTRHSQGLRSFVSPGHIGRFFSELMTVAFAISRRRRFGTTPTGRLQWSCHDFTQVARGPPHTLGTPRQSALKRNRQNKNSLSFFMTQQYACIDLPRTSSVEPLSPIFAMSATAGSRFRIEKRRRAIHR